MLQNRTHPRGSPRAEPVTAAASRAKGKTIVAPKASKPPDAAEAASAPAAPATPTMPTMWSFSVGGRRYGVDLPHLGFVTAVAVWCAWYGINAWNAQKTVTNLILIVPGVIGAMVLYAVIAIKCFKRVPALPARTDVTTGDTLDAQADTGARMRSRDDANAGAGSHASVGAGAGGHANAVIHAETGAWTSADSHADLTLDTNAAPHIEPDATHDLSVLATGRKPLKPGLARKIAVTMAMLIAFVIVAPTLGFDLGCFVYIAGMLLFAGERRLWILIGVPLIFCGLAIYCFSELLYTPLPLMFFRGDS